jgi:hypothetical protein
MQTARETTEILFDNCKYLTPADANGKGDNGNIILPLQIPNTSSKKFSTNTDITTLS